MAEGGDERRPYTVSQFHGRDARATFAGRLRS